MNTAFTQTNALQTNSNIPISTPMQNVSLEQVEEVVWLRLNNSLLYQVQCVTCEEAAVLLSVDTDTVREWIKAGKLLASKVGREWSIRVWDIDRMLTKHANVFRIDDKRYKKNRKAC